MRHELRLRVLIAEDHDLVRDVLTRVIEDDGSLEVVGAARDADEAISLARLLMPDVALIDVRMPGGGHRAVREIRVTSPATHVVALSSLAERSDVLDMLRAGACSYLVKGGGNRELRRSIRRAGRGGGDPVEVGEELAEEMLASLQRSGRSEHACALVADVR